LLDRLAGFDLCVGARSNWIGRCHAAGRVCVGERTQCHSDALQQTAQSMQSDLTKMRIEKWKTDGATKNRRWRTWIHPTQPAVGTARDFGAT